MFDVGKSSGRRRKGSVIMDEHHTNVPGPESILYKPFDSDTNEHDFLHAECYLRICVSLI